MLGSVQRSFVRGTDDDKLSLTAGESTTLMDTVLSLYKRQPLCCRFVRQCGWCDTSISDVFCIGNLHDSG